jgi:hypothetical protein
MRTLLVGFGLTTGLAACTLASPTYITATQEATAHDAGSEAAASAGGGGGPGATCGTDDFTKPDVSKLTACGNGKGHCYDATKLSISNVLAPCPDQSQVCVPDEVLAAGGGKLKSCTSIIGPGGCVTAALFPQIAAQGGGALQQDVCDPGLTCVPCTDPTHNNAPTPFCQPIGVHDKACTAPVSSAPGGEAGAPPPDGPACCGGAGACVAESAVPAAEQGHTKTDTCAGGNQCVPKGNPVSCNDPVLGRGFCIDKCFDGMLPGGGPGLLKTNGCPGTELCVPCGIGKSVPGCS